MGHYRRCHEEWEWLVTSHDHIGSGIRLRSAIVAYMLSASAIQTMLEYPEQGYYRDQPEVHRQYARNECFRPHPDGEEVQNFYSLPRRVININATGLASLSNRLLRMDDCAWLVQRAGEEAPPPHPLPAEQVPPQNKRPGAAVDGANKRHASMPPTQHVTPTQRSTSVIRSTRAALIGDQPQAGPSHNYGQTERSPSYRPDEPNLPISSPPPPLEDVGDVEITREIINVRSPSMVYSPSMDQLLDQ